MRKKSKKFVSATMAMTFAGLSILTDPSGQTIQAMAAQEKAGITIHYKSAWDTANIFYWNQNEGYNNPVSWPGEEMIPEEDGWY